MAARSRFLGPLERALYLGAIPLLADLDPDDLALIAEHGREVYLRPGEVAQAATEPVRTALVVVEGGLRATGEGRRDEVVGPREGVGMLSVLSRARRGLAAKAETDTICLGLDAETIHELFEDHFTLVIHEMRAIAGRTLAIRRRQPPLSFLATRPEPVRCPERGLDLVERIVLLRSGGPFANASLDALASLAAQLEEVRVKPGETLWREGEPSGYLLLILNGIVRCRVGDGRVFRCGPVYPLGNLDSLCGEPRWYTAVAETPLVALRADIDVLIDTLEDHFDIAMDFLAAMATNLVEHLEREADAR